MNDFIPSQNVEVEEAIIGCCLHLGKAPTIPPDAFYRESHRKIVGTLQGMERHKKPIDLLMTVEALDAKGLREEIGGATYLAQCFMEVSKPENLSFYESHIMNHWQKRQIQTQCCQIGALANEATPEKAIQWMASIEKAVNGCSCEEGPPSMLDGMKALIADLDAKQERGGGLLGISCGIESLDKQLSGLCHSDLIVLAGRPGMGKTALGLTIAKNVAKRGEKVLFVSLEMDRKQLLYRIVAQLSGVNLQDLRSGSLSNADYLRASHAMKEAIGWPLLIDDRPSRNELQVVAEAKKHLPSLLIIDYLGRMKSTLKSERKDLELGEITGALKDLAKELNIPVLLLCQLNRKVEERSGKERRPILSDLKDSGSIEQDADVVMFVYNDEKNDASSSDAGISEIIIGKQRNGPTGMIPVGYQAHCTAFFDLAHDDVEAFWGRRKQKRGAR